MSHSTVERVILDRSTVDFAHWEANELFENARNVRTGDNVDVKIRNCVIGSFGQQVLINETGARRVSKDECYDFSYDVVCNHASLVKWTGYRDPSLTRETARIEVKTLVMENNRRWLTFNVKNFSYARRCAKSNRFDYMTFFGVDDIDFREYSANVRFLGIVPASTIATNSYWNPSKFNPEQIYLNHFEVNANKTGMILL